MKPNRITIVCGLSAISISLIHGFISAQEPIEGKLAEISDTLNTCNAALIKSTDSLIPIIENTKCSNTERRNAVVLLGKVNCVKSINYLIDNVLLEIEIDDFSGSSKGDGAIAEVHPCRHALLSGDWRTAEAILKNVANKKSNEELMSLAEVERVLLGQSVAAKAIDRLLRNNASKDELWTKNLAALKTHIVLEPK